MATPSHRTRETNAMVFDDTRRPRDRCGDQGRVGDRREVDEPHSIGMLGQRVGSHLEGEARLTCPTGTGEREQAGSRGRIRQQPLHLGHLSLPPYETGHLLGQVVGQRIQ